jgi:hypothetical protein
VTPERGILELIVGRLEPLVGHVRVAHHVAWVGSKEEKISPERWIELHFASAFLMARDALRSNDEEKIAEAVRWAPGFERTAMELRDKLRVAHDTEKSKKGGKKRGEDLTSKATAAWGPYVATYYELLAGGMSVTRARQKVSKRIEKDGFTPPGGKKDELPDLRTIRNWLPDPMKK